MSMAPPTHCRGGEREQRLRHWSLDEASAGFNSKRMNPNSGVKLVANHNALLRPKGVPNHGRLIPSPRKSADADAAVHGLQPSAVDIMR